MRRLQSTPEKLREELSKLLWRLEYGDVIRQMVLELIFLAIAYRSY